MFYFLLKFVYLHGYIGEYIVLSGSLTMQKTNETEAPQGVAVAGPMEAEGVDA